MINGALLEILTFLLTKRRNYVEILLFPSKINGEWNLIFPKAVSVMDATISSDHAPIILLLSGSGMKISSLNPNGLLRKIALAMSRKLGSLSSSP
ncbi:hypothetical protein V6N12_073558 [Hibiscus sabdariffa]|uniref:Endonuclease/exonuclease/phosphatase domain-containing protein n=1 Tax=Hibiscus sabdariffa TaxID=183260 RepID=A0ABR2BJ83_9ROSI